ncbi:mitochondrial carrier domain-containing protein [Cokeromyces recurvatus]|uniref:mitochondrial carrier domain-containing protein n=1 Tax=Cokeromyces recurvatus TaxID=90255 RepID=UPI00221F4F3A|nr:mitochondrial carrier domain-containing protein [Cokeromyces recurvatus]KAI7903513.1 mitochondrial carrier domain-containing protein [Cokeromyces recurvatus]
MAQNAMAGAMAGIGEHCIMYPVDSIRTRMQVLTTPEINKAIKHASKESWHGSRNLWKGVYSVIVGAGPAHAVHFATYEFCKEWLNDQLSATSKLQTTGRSFTISNQLIASGTAGAIATFAHDALMTPFDVLKQRMQLRDSTYHSVRDCAKRVYSAEGIKAFYISFPTTVSMSIPFQSVQFATYEFFRSKLNPEGSYNPKAHMLAGAIAGAVASSVTTPLDVIKTLLQTKGSSTDTQIKNVNGLKEAASIIYERYGFKGFFRGFKPRVLTNMPSTAISWSVYEYFKWFLASDDEDKFIDRI